MLPANPVLLPESSVLRLDSRNQIPYCQIVHLSTKLPLLQAGKSVWSSTAALLGDTLTPTIPLCLAGAAGSAGPALFPIFGGLQNFSDAQMYSGILLMRVLQRCVALECFACQEWWQCWARVTPGETRQHQCSCWDGSLYGLN